MFLGYVSQANEMMTLKVMKCYKEKFCSRTSKLAKVGLEKSFEEELIGNQ